MERREIKWTLRARVERDEILDFWYLKNKSILYSEKLNTLFWTTISLIAEHPEAGKTLNKERAIYYILVKSYRIYYHFTAKEFTVLSIWDTRRNPEKIKI